MVLSNYLVTGEMGMYLKCYGMPFVVLCAFQ